MNTPLLPEDDQPLRIKTMADWLGVHDKTVRRLLESEAIKSVKMRGLRVVMRSDFKAYVEKLKKSGGVHV